MSNLEHDDTLLARWLEGSLTPLEKKELEQHPDFPVFQRMVAAADKMAVSEDAATDMWKKMQAHPDMRSVRPKAVWKSLYFIAAAAAVTVALLVFLWPIAPSAIGSHSGNGANWYWSTARHKIARWNNGNPECDV